MSISKKACLLITEISLIILIFVYKLFVIPSYYFWEAFLFNLQLIIYVGIITHWSIMINRRVMHKRLKLYLLLFSSMSIFWFLLKCFKWSAFVFLESFSRFTWYLFYIPIIIVPLYGFFITLYMNKDENYRINKKWNLLYIPAILLILLVASNDLHQSVFRFNENFFNWNLDYSYKFGYIIVLVFTVSTVAATVYVLLKKWRKLYIDKKSYYPLAVILLGILYLFVYIFNRHIISASIDITTFTCFWYLLFWESFIKADVIRSNKNHENFFINSKISTQILDKFGNVKISSKDAVNLNTQQIEYLKENLSLKFNEKTILNIATINCGYVIWKNDISKITKMNNQLTSINSKLLGEIEILTREKTLKENRIRVEKLNQIHSRISSETLSSVKKIKELINIATYSQNNDKILKQVNLISCYVKRKSNLLLIETNITDNDMISSYYESFRGLELIGTQCNLNYKFSKPIDSNIHLFCYDFFEEVIEKSGFKLNILFINTSLSDGFIFFRITVSKQSNLSPNSLNCFKKDELKNLNGNIKIYDDEDSCVFVLTFKEKP